MMKFCICLNEFLIVLNKNWLIVHQFLHEIISQCLLNLLIIFIQPFDSGIY